MPDPISFRPNDEDQQILDAIVKLLELSTLQPAYYTAAIRYALRITAEVRALEQQEEVDE